MTGPACFRTDSQMNANSVSNLIQRQRAVGVEAAALALRPCDKLPDIIAPRLIGFLVRLRVKPSSERIQHNLSTIADAQRVSQQVGRQAFRVIEREVWQDRQFGCRHFEPGLVVASEFAGVSKKFRVRSKR